MAFIEDTSRIEVLEKKVASLERLVRQLRNQQSTSSERGITVLDDSLDLKLAAVINNHFKDCRKNRRISLLASHLLQDSM